MFTLPAIKFPLSVDDRVANMRCKRDVRDEQLLSFSSFEITGTLRLYKDGPCPELKGRMFDLPDGLLSLYLHPWTMCSSSRKPLM